MVRRNRRPRPQLRVEQLEGRITPAANFKILSLTANNSFATDVNFVVGDDHGGIATTANSVFLTGDSQTGRFDLPNLLNPVGTGFVREGLTSDLQLQTAYVLGIGPNTPLPTFPVNPTVTDLLVLNSTTGALTGASVHLSTPIVLTGQPFSNEAGIFAGYGRIVLHPFNGPVYEVALPSGTVTVLNPGLASPFPYAASESFAYYGTAEHFGGDDYIDYVQDPQNIVRQRVSNGIVTPLASFANLGDMASFTVSPSNGRWYFHNDGFSQFFNGAEGLDYADATFQGIDYTVLNTNDSGAGSLREKIGLANAAPGAQTIGFKAGLTGTITLTSGDLDIKESVEIQGQGSGNITIQGDASNRIFTDNTLANLTLTLSGLTLNNPAGFAFPYHVSSDGDVVMDSGPSDISFSKTLDVSGGTLNLKDSNGVTFGPTINMNGGTLDAGTVAVQGGNILQGYGTVDGDVNVTAGSSMGLNGTVNGDVNATGGSVTLNGIVNGDVKASAASTLSMTGTVTGNLDVEGSSEFSPNGAAIGLLSIGGDLTFGTGGYWRAQLDGPGFNDYLDVAGDVHLGTNPSNVVFQLNYSAFPGDSNYLINNSGANPVIGGLAAVGNHYGTVIAGTVFQFRYDDGDGNDVVIVANSSPDLTSNITTNLTPILEDTPAATNMGTSIKALVETGGLYSDSQGLLHSGIALTGVDSTNGKWQWTTDNGVDWNNVGSVSPTSAVLLEADVLQQQRIRFLPNADFYGTADISFRAWDLTNGLAAGNSGQDATGGGFNSAYSDTEVSATLNVLSVNDPPDAVNDTVNPSLLEDGGAQTINVLLNDSVGPDPNETLSITSVTQGAHGTVAIVGGTMVTYKPDGNFNGTDSFLYSIGDGNGGSDFATVTVTVANDAADRLEVVTSPGITAFTEGGVAIGVDSGIVLGTADEATITGATVKISSGFVPKKDTLALPPTPGGIIKGKFNPKTGVLTITGAASIADYQAALRSVTYFNGSVAPVGGQRKITLQIQDNGGLGDPAYKLLNVTATNSKSIVTLPATSVAYKLGKKGAGVLAGIKLTDVDNTRLQSATLTITGGFTAGDQLVAVTTKTGLAATYLAGVLTLTGNASLATYLKVLKSIKFTATAGAGVGRTLTLTVNDGLDISAPVMRSVTVS